MTGEQAVTVLLPARRAASTLPAALTSLRQQTLRAFACIVVNDGADPATRAAALKTWQGEDPQLRPLTLIELPFVGLVGALNAGLARCTTPWVARMDADDLAHPERLARQLAHLHAYPRTDVLACGVRSFAAAGTQEGFRLYDSWQNSLLTHADIMRERFIDSPVVHPTVMFKRATVQAAGGYRELPWAEDYDLWLRLAGRQACFAKLPEVLLSWRDHAARATRSDGRYRQDAMLRCKAHHLANGPLAGTSPVIWGAGAVGRRLSRRLEAEGCGPRAFIDVDARKVGGVRRGHIPVLATSALPTLRGAPLVAAVGSRGAREAIRLVVQEAGWTEGVDFWCAA